MERPALILALDRPSLKENLMVLERLPEAIRQVKVGLELFTAEGPQALRELQARGKRIFLDLKLHDIPNTVARAVTAAAALGVSMLTLHASGGRAMLQAAVAAARRYGPQAPRLLAVTALTSLAPEDLPTIGVQRYMTEHVLALGSLALDCGLDGLVCSAHEASALRQSFGSDPLLVIPGIRPAGNAHADQKRGATPAAAVAAGATFLVVGRPILEASDPQAAALAILNEMAAAAQKI